MEFVFDREVFLRRAAIGVLSQAPTVLYLIRCDHYVKVGIAGDIKKRLFGLQCSNPRRIELGAKFQFADRQYAGIAERAALAALKPANTFGEWFDAEYGRVHSLVVEIVSATREMKRRHDKELQAYVSSERERYASDAAYRAKQDARDARLQQEQERWLAKEAAMNRAALEFEELHRDVPA